MAYEAESFREHNEVRLPTLRTLLSLGWSRGQIACPSPDSTDKEWRIPKNPSAQAARERGRSYKSYPCDMALFDSVEGAMDPNHIVILVECKLPGDPSGLSELETYLTLEPHAHMGVLTNGQDVTRTYKLSNGSFKRVHGSTLPAPDENFYATEGPLQWSDLHAPTEDQLKSTFRRLLNVVVSTDGTSTRSDDRLNEICNLLLLKLESDSWAKRHQKQPVWFQIGPTPHDTARSIDERFEQYRRRNSSLFGEDEGHRLRLDNATVHAAVYELQNFTIADMSPTALSYAFQVFRSANLKMGEGQYYTPYRVIQAGTKMMGVSADDRVIDPACGTGGFLSQAFLTVRDSIGETEATRWANRNLFGIDLDNINIKIVRALMVGIGDGSTNAFAGDSLRERKWSGDSHGISGAMHNESYTVVLTNPPFGKGLKLTAADAREAQYSICNRAHASGGVRYADTEIGIAFVERAWRLLEKGGRLGIVLPETYFFSKSYAWFREWLDAHFALLGVLNIPMEAFQGFCRAKTNFYVFEKIGVTRKAPHSVWFSYDSIWISDAPTIGINKDGDELYTVDPRTHQRTSVIDNRALLDVESLVEGSGVTDTAQFVPRVGMADSLIGVPRYSNRRSLEEHEAWVARSLPDFFPISLGELVASGHIHARMGHGSPSADLRGGDIPYIKVSDLRNGMLNPNRSNTVPRQVAKHYWREESSGLNPYDILTPTRASKNIGEPVMLLPGQEDVVLTKEILILSVCKDAPFDSFYLMWALRNEYVLAQWGRVVYMQTNREDLGERWKEIAIPLPPNKETADTYSKPYRDYYTGMAALQQALANSLAKQADALAQNNPEGV